LVPFFGAPPPPPPPLARWGLHSAPRPGIVKFPGREGLLRRRPRVCAVRLVVGDHHEALTRGVVAPGAGVVGVAEAVVRGVKEPPEHHQVRHAGEVPLRVPVRGGGWQLAGRAVVGLVVGGGARVPDRRDMATRTAPARRHVGVGGGGVCRCGAAQAEGEPWSGNCASRCRSGCRLASDRVALRGDARGPSSFRPHLSRALTGASSALRRRRARSVHSSGRRGVSSGCGVDWSWPGRPPCVKLVAVGNAHGVAVPRGLKVQAPEPDFEPGWEGARAAHGIPLAPILGADHHREGLWKLIFSAKSPTWRANCRCGK
jgi:hypothetical protein